MLNAPGRLDVAVSTISFQQQTKSRVNLQSIPAIDFGSKTSDSRNPITTLNREITAAGIIEEQIRMILGGVFFLKQMQKLYIPG